MTISAQVAMARQICVFTAFSLLPISGSHSKRKMRKQISNRRQIFVQKHPPILGVIQVISKLAGHLWLEYCFKENRISGFGKRSKGRPTGSPLWYYNSRSYTYQKLSASV
jgi:hypothetical protein